MPNMPATLSIWTRLAPVTLREREDAQWHQRVARRELPDDEAGEQRQRADGTAEGRWPASQPYSAAGLTIVKTPSISALVTSTAPGHRRRPQPDTRSDGISRRASTAVAMPIGRLTKKIQCQLIAWVSTPPASSPTAPPADATNA